MAHPRRRTVSPSQLRRHQHPTCLKHAPTAALCRPHTPGRARPRTAGCSSAASAAASPRRKRRFLRAFSRFDCRAGPSFQLLLASVSFHGPAPSPGSTAGQDQVFNCFSCPYLFMVPRLLQVRLPRLSESACASAHVVNTMASSVESLPPSRSPPSIPPRTRRSRRAIRVRCVRRGGIHGRRPGSTHAIHPSIRVMRHPSLPLPSQSLPPSLPLPPPPPSPCLYEPTFAAALLGSKASAASDTDCTCTRARLGWRPFRARNERCPSARAHDSDAATAGPVGVCVGLPPGARSVTEHGVAGP